MRTLLIIILLVGGAATFTNAQTIQSDALRFPGTDLHTIAQFSQAKRDSILVSISNFDENRITVPDSAMLPAHQQQLRAIISQMLQTVRQVLKDPATAEEMEKRMGALNKRLYALQDDIAYEENLRILKADYEEDLNRRKREYEAQNYSSEKEKRIAKRELEQELRDIRRDFEEEKARLKKS